MSRLRLTTLVALLTLSVGGVSLSAQGVPAGEWVHPYASAPGLWELVGRLFPDTPELRRDRTFRGFLEPSILAAGTIRPKTRAGEILGSFVRFLPFQEKNVLNADLAPDRLVVADVTQVIFVARDGNAVRLETRVGDPSSEFQRCYDARHTQLAHLTDIRVQSALACDAALFWTAWRGQVPVSFDAEGRGSLLLDQLGLLSLTLDPRTTELSATIGTPPVGGGLGPRPR
ncbi:MAG: hypothetical protein ABL986_04275 [Vicinamibacterales bacterium]